MLRKFILLMVVLGLMTAPQFAPRSYASDEEPATVARISYIDGHLLRYVDTEKDWVATTKDAPFGMNDSLYTDERGKAEFIVPNQTRIRIGSTTQLQAISLTPDASEVDVASGVARFYNMGSDLVVKATTPFGYVLAPAGSIFDLYVGDQSLEIIAIRGNVEYIQNEQRYDVAAGSPSLLADSHTVSSGSGTVDSSWDSWNGDRDRLWEKRQEITGESARYLPRQLHDDASVLDEDGRWERVYYQNEYQEMWRPTNVDPDWRPFSSGRWVDYYGDQCWVPDESFGYVTHHYGNWVYVDGGWFWSPPVVSVEVRVGRAAGFGWYPGRVAWIGSDENVGWIPLAPTEVYYAHNHWGRGGGISVVRVGAPLPVIAIATLAFISAGPMIVPQSHFYGASNYRDVRVTRNVNITNITNNYSAAPVVTNKVVHNQYLNNPQRFSSVNTPLQTKPAAALTQRIDHNVALAKSGGPVNVASLHAAAHNTRLATPISNANIAPPKVTNALVPASQASQVKTLSSLPTREIKTNAVQPKPTPLSSTGTTTPGASTQQPGLTGPRTPRAPETSASGATTQQPAVTGPRTPRTSNTVVPGATMQQPGLTSPRTPRAPETSASGATMQQPAVPSPRTPRTPDTVVPGATMQQPGLTSPRTPRAPETSASGATTQQPAVTSPRTPRTPDTTVPGATMQQPGLTSPRTPRAPETSASGATTQQQQKAEQEQQLKTQQQQQQKAEQGQQLKAQQQQQQRAEQEQQLKAQQQQQQKAEQQQQLKAQQQQQQRAEQEQQLKAQQQQQQKAEQQQQLKAQQQQQQRAEQEQQLKAQQQQQQRAEQQQQQQKAQQQQQQQKAEQQQQKAQQQQQPQQQKAQQQQAQQQQQQQKEALHKFCQQNPDDPKCKQK